MSLSAQIQQQFLMAAENDPSLQKPMTQSIEIETFRQILEPVTDFLDQDPVYGRYEMSTSRQVDELRKMCLEAYAAHSTQDQDVREGRISLLNALQSLQESIQETEETGANFVSIHKEDRDTLSAMTDVMQEASDIHGGFLHNYPVAVTLERTVETLSQAIEGNFIPKVSIDIDADASNDDVYAQYGLEFQMAATSQVASPNTLAENEAKFEQHDIA